MTRFPTERLGAESPRWAFFQALQVKHDGEPYLDRLRIIQTPLFAVFLHRIHKDDLDRDPHDHPWWFVSLVISGSYEEEIWNTADVAADPYCYQVVSVARIRVHGRFSVHATSRKIIHRITRIDGLLWTVLVTGRRHRSWNFWPDSGPVDWREYYSRQNSN